ncbi:MAG TPA: hypothetical protein VFG52_03820 [Xanthomonadales bacterium]|nr:hypothetical protein [Xanthomonadales bacterium]
MKKLFITLALIMLVGAGLAWYFVSVRLDSMIESRLERAATASLGNHVEVGGVETDLRNGTLTVREISVANPPGYRNPYAMRFNGVEAAVDYETQEIRRVVIDRPEFLIEELGGTTNFQQMLDALEAGEDVVPAGDPAKPEAEITIRHFRIDGARAGFESEALDRYTELNVDAIELNDLKGTPTELANEIGRKVLEELSSEAGMALMEAQARKKAGDLGEKVGNSLGKIFGKDDEATDPPDSEN